MTKLTNDCHQEDKKVKARIGKLVGFLVLVLSVLTLLPSSVSAQCAQWEVGGRWSIQQSTIVVHFDLQRNGIVVTGKANYTQAGQETKFLGAVVKGGDSVVHYGDVDGTSTGNSFTVHVYWDNHKSIGVYTGRISPSGKIEGEVYGEERPSVKGQWYSRSSMSCVPVHVAAPPPPPAPHGIRKSAKAQVGATDNVPVATVGPTATAGTAPMIRAMPANSFGLQKTNGRTTLTWDGGKNHPYAELWVKIDGADEKFVVEQGKGTRDVTIEHGKTYVYILTDSGTTLATVTLKD